MAAMAAAMRPYATTARSKAGPMLRQAQERMTPMMTGMRQRLVRAVADAAVASEPYRKEAARRGRLAWAALRGEAPAPSPRPRHWMRWSLLLGGIGAAGAAAVAYRSMRDGSAPEPWHPTDPTAPRQRSHSPDDEASTGTSGGSTSDSGRSTGSAGSGQNASSRSSGSTRPASSGAADGGREPAGVGKKGTDRHASRSKRTDA